MSDRYAGLPFTDDDATIAKALEDVSVPTLLVSLVHLTGDASILDGPLRPAGIYLNEVQGFMSPEDQAAARAFALEKIIEFRDGGCVLPPPPSDEVVHRMMEFLVAGEVPDEYVPLMLEELAFDGGDARAVDWVDEVAPAAKDAFHVVIIGAGMSGLLAGIKLGEAGIPFTIIEKNAGVGGTWYENRYPGCRVDVGNHFYSYSFAPDDEWSEFFAQQPELQAYFDRCMHDYGVADHIRFETEVTSARWDDASSTWTVETTGAHGGPLVANAVISAVGQLNRPKLPDIPGRDTFEGAAMHSAAWVDGTDTRRQAGRRGRHRRQRLPAGPHHRPRCRAPHGVPAVGAVDVPQPELPRAGRPGRGVGDPAPPVLRALVPLPDLLAGAATPGWWRWRSTPSTRTPSTGSAPSTTPPETCSPSGWPTRSATIRSCSPRWCRTTCASASARSRTTAAGSAR